MSSNSNKPLSPPLPNLSGSEICSPLFSWKDCFLASTDQLNSGDVSGEQNQQPCLPPNKTPVEFKTVTKQEHTQAPQRDHSPLADISSVPSIFDHPFQNLPDSDLGNITSSLTMSTSSDSETSSSTMQTPSKSPSMSPDAPIKWKERNVQQESDYLAPPPQKKMKREAPMGPRSMLRPNSAYLLPPAAQYTPSYNNDLMRELSQLPNMFHPAALPCILPGENGEELLARASPRLAPMTLKKEKKMTPRAQSNCGMRTILSGKRQSRKKTNVACTNCVRAKAGCDQGRPCSRCRRLGKTNCVDRPINQRRRRKVTRVGRFVDEDNRSAERVDSRRSVRNPPSEYILGSYNGDADGYIDYYMRRDSRRLARVQNTSMVTSMGPAGYIPHGQIHKPQHSNIPPPPLPPVPSLNGLNAMAPQRNGVIYYGQTNWASWNPIPPPVPPPTMTHKMEEDTTKPDAMMTPPLFASGDVGAQELSPSLSAMDMSKPTQTNAFQESQSNETTLKHEIQRPTTIHPKPLALYYY